MQNSKETVFNEILTSKDIRKLLCVSQSTVQRMRKKGELTGYKMSGRVYYKRSEVLSSLESGKLNSACDVATTKEKVGSSSKSGSEN